MTETTPVTDQAVVVDEAVVVPTADDGETTPTSEAAAITAADEVVRNSHRKTREGLVISDKMDKTVVVAVEDRVKHPLYGKVLRRTSKLKAHDSTNQVGVGDRVLIMETRPMSATKRWRIVEVIERAK